ncbi:MAG: DNA-binding response regulator [Deltaproteobacteria bacterium]|jgi:DNA-binding NarL/FixJ family response regulator|nr:MAG: DNA-binding response regulator [Deltaproteobacteria bacterium]
MDSKKTLNVVMASTSRLFLEGLKKILEETGEISVVAEVFCREDIKKSVTEKKPDLLFIDNRVFNIDPVDISKTVAKKTPTTRIIILENNPERMPSLQNTLYVSRDTSSQELLSLIKEKQKPVTEGSKKNLQKKKKLTPMETQIVELITHGLNNKEIAKKLRISEKTVKAHLTSIFTKLDIQNRYQLMVYAKNKKNQSSEKNSSNQR